MSNAVLASPIQSPAPHAHGAHARAASAPEIRVIRGGLLDEKSPRHAKRTSSSSLRGADYNLSACEHAKAVGFGILFTLAALAAAVG